MSDGREPVESLQSRQRTVAEFWDFPIPDLIRLGIVHNGEATEPLTIHTHPDSFEICCHLSGQQLFAVGQEQYITKGGSLFLTFPDEEHGTGGFPMEKSSFYYLIFRCPRDTHSLLGLPEADSLWIRDTLWGCRKRVFSGDRQIPALLGQILAVFFSREPMREQRIRALFVQFFYLLCTCIRSPATGEAPLPGDIAEAAGYIALHFREALSLQALADRVNLSQSQFKRKFRQFMGFSPHDYLLLQKINQARLLLRTTGRTVTDIALELGFSSGQHFATAFRMYTGQTPTQYRSEGCTESDHGRIPKDKLPFGP